MWVCRAVGRVWMQVRVVLDVVPVAEIPIELWGGGNAVHGVNGAAMGRA